MTQTYALTQSRCSHHLRRLAVGPTASSAQCRLVEEQYLPVWSRPHGVISTEPPRALLQ